MSSSTALGANVVIYLAFRAAALRRPSQAAAQYVVFWERANGRRRPFFSASNFAASSDRRVRSPRNSSRSPRRCHYRRVYCEKIRPGNIRRREPGQGVSVEKTPAIISAVFSRVPLAFRNDYRRCGETNCSSAFAVSRESTLWPLDDNLRF